MRKATVIAGDVFHPCDCLSRAAGALLCILLLAAWTPAKAELRPGGEPLVVIDPGHGGSDAGVRSGKLQEKDVAMVLAQRLRRKLETNLGIRVQLTRDGDVGLATLERSALAGREKATLFLSLHLGFSVEPDADTVTVFHSLPRPPAEPQAGSSGLWRAWDRQQEPWLEASRRLAGMVQEELAAWEKNDRATPVGASIPLLSGVDCPAILLELGCLTNPARAARVADERYLEEAAQVLYRTLAAYLAQ